MRVGGRVGGIPASKHKGDINGTPGKSYPPYTEAGCRAYQSPRTFPHLPPRIRALPQPRNPTHLDSVLARYFLSCWSVSRRDPIDVSGRKI